MLNSSLRKYLIEYISNVKLNIEMNEEYIKYIYKNTLCINTKNYT